MKTIKILSAVFAFFMIIILGIAIFLPADIHIKKSIKVKGELGVVYNEINDLHNWNNWSPWKDSTLFTKYEGSEKGVGAKMLWTDQKEGRATLSIIENTYFSSIKTEMDVPEKVEKAEMIFTFEKEGDSVLVVWERHINDLGFPMERYVGWMLERGYNYNFELGLKGLKEYVETNLSTADYNGYTIEIVELEERSYLAVNDSGNAETTSEVMSKAFGSIMEYAAQLDIQAQGPSMVQWHKYNPAAYSHFTSLIPFIVDGPITPEKIYHFTMPSTKVAMVRYIGPYEASYNAWMALDNYIVFNSLIMDGDPWEEYIVSPYNETDSTKFVTNICFPIQ